MNCDSWIVTHGQLVLAAVTDLWRYVHVSDLIINVEVPLALILAHHPGLLQQEVWDFATDWFSSSAELNLEIFPLVDAKPKSTMGGDKQAD